MRNSSARNAKNINNKGITKNGFKIKTGKKAISNRNLRHLFRGNFCKYHGMTDPSTKRTLLLNFSQKKVYYQFYMPELRLLWNFQHPRGCCLS